MNIPESFILDALEQVLAWELPEDVITDITNALASQMAGRCHYFYDE